MPTIRSFLSTLLDSRSKGSCRAYFAKLNLRLALDLTLKKSIARVLHTVRNNEIVHVRKDKAEDDSPVINGHWHFHDGSGTQAQSDCESCYDRE